MFSFIFWEQLHTCNLLIWSLLWLKSLDFFWQDSCSGWRQNVRNDGTRLFVIPIVWDFEDLRDEQLAFQLTDMMVVVVVVTGRYIYNIRSFWMTFCH